MFTGIIKEVGNILAVEKISGGVQLEIACSFSADLNVDESVCVNGVCLTVIHQNHSKFEVQCVEETLRKTTFASVKQGDRVNLERSLTMDKALEGHIVQGHVDAVGRVDSITEEGNDRLLVISYPENDRPYIVGRGSITVDGISLTVAREQESVFTVAVIPYTWDFTNLNRLSPGDSVNLEYDIFGKYVVRYLEQQKKDSASEAGRPSGSGFSEG